MFYQILKMKTRLISFLFLILLFFACEETPADKSTPPSPNSGIMDGDPAGLNTDNRASNTIHTNAKRGTKETMDCKIPGQRMEDNELWVKEQGIFITVLADSTTYESDFGESYRILSVMDTDSCKEIYRKTLPVNFSPDFPYYLSTNIYNTKKGLICSQGFHQTYCYDLNKRLALPGLKPQYLNKRKDIDAQSGMPQGLELQDDYLFGLVQDYGVFVYDLSKPQAPKPVLPIAEYISPDDNVHPLFILPNNKTKTYQAYVMQMDEAEMEIDLKALLEQPLKNKPSFQKSENNRFIIFESNDRKFAIDLQNQKSIEIPEDIAQQSSEKAFQWLKKQ